MSPYLTSFISELIDIRTMALIKSVKRIGTAGTSKIVPVTQEIKALELGVKDSVVVALAVPGSEEEYALDLASAFTNPDVYYVNNRIMCTKDRYPDGRYIENRLNKKNIENCEQVLRRMTAMQDLIDVMREHTKNKVSGPCAYYNDELHSFVARFDPEEIEYGDDYNSNLKDLIAQMDLLNACLVSDVFKSSPLSSVGVLAKNVARALTDANALLACAPVERDGCIEYLNAVWSEEVSNIVYCDLFFVGCIVQYYSEERPIFRWFPEFMVAPAPTRRMALEKLQNLATDMIDDGNKAAVFVFGPYEDESECRDIVSYLKIKWKVEVNECADEYTATWVKNALNDYNNSIGE